MDICKIRRIFALRHPAVSSPLASLRCPSSPNKSNPPCISPLFPAPSTRASRTPTIYLASTASVSSRGLTAPPSDAIQLSKPSARLAYLRRCPRRPCPSTLIYIALPPTTPATPPESTPSFPSARMRRVLRSSCISYSHTRERRFSLYPAPVFNQLRVSTAAAASFSPRGAIP